MSKFEAILSSHDAWIFILSTIRYAMGRRSYMPTLSRDLFYKYQDLLDEQQIDQVYTEVAKELKRCERAGTTLGAEFDHKGWKNFIEGKIDYDKI